MEAAMSFHAMENPEPVFDVTIVGGGPVGLFAAYCAGFRGLRVKIVDSLSELGGQVAALYPEKFLYDVAGFPQVLGKELVRNLIRQAGKYQPAVCLEEEVLEIRRDAAGGTGFASGNAGFAAGAILIRTDKGEHVSRAVILASGVGGFKPRGFENPAIDGYAGRGLVFSVREVRDFEGKQILIVGGGDSAVDWALNLLPYARSITLIHRREQFRAHEGSVAEMKRSRVKIRVPYTLHALKGEGQVASAVIVHAVNGQAEEIPADSVIACLGFHTSGTRWSSWGLEVEEGGIRVGNSRMETNIPGIYAAGDVARYPGKVKLIATGFGEAATAVNNAAIFLDPSKKLFPGHSSSGGP